MATARGDITYLTQAQAVRVDEELMGEVLGFSIDQLMELAGLSCACSVASVYQAPSRVLIICGPGNNGGDGLVCARHLHHFGHQVSVCYPKPTDRALYHGLVKQCRALGIPFVSPDDMLARPLSEQTDVVVDAMFGFSFKGDPRPPFDKILAALVPEASPPPIASVDIPSGWQVEEGDVGGKGIKPTMLISLTAPKLCARKFEGPHHFLGGRFVPPAIAEQFGLVLPAYPGTEQCVRI